MAEGRFRMVPFTIANGASLSSVVDLGPTGVLVGIAIDGAWTAAKISFLGYIEQSGKVSASDVTAAMPWTDPNAVYDQISDQTGTAIQVGNGTAISKQYLTWSDTFLPATRAIKVQSGTVLAFVNQAQAVNGFVIVRDLR